MTEFFEDRTVSDSGHVFMQPKAFEPAAGRRFPVMVVQRRNRWNPLSRWTCIEDGVDLDWRYWSKWDAKKHRYDVQSFDLAVYRMGY